jgi:tetratricopeptide (TPR) repeat protein
MNKTWYVLLFLGFSTSVWADIIDKLPVNEAEKIDLIDPKLDEEIKRAETENDDFALTMLYFLGGDEEYYAGSLFLDNGDLTLIYWPPGQEGFFENGSCIMAYNITGESIQLIIKKWMCYHADNTDDKKIKDIVYYRVELTETDGEIGYTCAYTTPALDLHDYVINAAEVSDENVYAYAAPSFKAEKIAALEKGEHVKVLPTKLAENEPEEEPYDFWYKIALDNKEAWVYGYHIVFTNRIAMNKFAQTDDAGAYAYNNRGVYCIESGILGEAIEAFTEAIRRKADFAEAYYNRGLAWTDTGEPDKAIADYTEAIRLRPANVWVYYNRGYVYEARGEYDKAIADYSEAIRLRPADVQAYYNRGYVYDIKKEYDKAIADYSEAIRQYPGYAEAYHNRGTACAKKGDYDKAIADYNEAIRLDADYAEAYYNRGLAWYYKKDHVRARADWETALQIEPGHAGARHNLELLQQKGY